MQSALRLVRAHHRVPVAHSFSCIELRSSTRSHGGARLPPDPARASKTNHTNPPLCSILLPLPNFIAPASFLSESRSLCALQAAGGPSHEDVLSPSTSWRRGGARSLGGVVNPHVHAGKTVEVRAL